MFEDLQSVEREGGPGGTEDELLRELERNTAGNIRSQRIHERVEIRSAVTALPGNASDRLATPVDGTTVDLSAGGCLVVFPHPLRVGDIYMLRFDRESIRLPLTFARCMRGRMVSEEAFEFGFSFFAQVDMAEALPPAAGAA